MYAAKFDLFVETIGIPSNYEKKDYPTDRIQHLIFLGKTYKYCSYDTHWVKTDFFHSSSKRWDGFDPLCINCKRIKKMSSPGYMKKDVPNICLSCNKNFIGVKEQKTCNRSCSSRLENKQRNSKREKIPGYTKRKELSCMECSKSFQQPRKNQKYCSKECSTSALIKRNQSEIHKEHSRRGGINSQKTLVRRSKNEIHFANLCIEYFGQDMVLTNVGYFLDDKGNKWDADVIIPELKLAISWNGAWHYKKLRENHSLELSQARDMIKDKLVKRMGFEHYIIKDMGGEKKSFVIEEFQKFLSYLIKIDNLKST